ncbi:MAG: LacI family DNA-binding transcriptional regulator [Anaerolineae bacterium]|nr:LacI family DNA-binding transcriptional regulator [Anaerolineae bacterium]
MIQKKRVTQADVARRAGVSQTAVSQILSSMDTGASSFRAETRQKVLEAAQALGYVPSRMARALRTNETMTIGVVVGILTDELELRITRGIHEIATERGYGLLIGDVEQNPELEQGVVERFLQYRVDGIIFVDCWPADPVKYLDDDLCPPTIFAQLRQLTIERNCIGADDVHGGYIATRHLLDLGYRKIACISGPEYWASAVERLKGYRKACEEFGLTYDPSLIEYGDWEVPSGVEATHRLLDRHPEIDAIFAANDRMAAGCIQAATSRGRHVPQDLALVGYDDRLLAEALTPPLTTFAYPLRQIGQEAAQMLIDQLLHRNERYTPSKITVGRLVVRASSGVVPAERQDDIDTVAGTPAPGSPGQIA